MAIEPTLTAGCKVLVVDDKKENLDLLSGILEGQGYEVSFAMDGEKAIHIASLDLPDLILLDIMMPGIDGFETCRRLKGLSQLRDIPVIFVTARVNVTDVVKGFSLGAVDYVTKPIRHEEIVARVETHLQLRRLMVIRDELIAKLRLQNIEQEKLSRLKDQQLEKNSKISYLGEVVGELTHELGTPLGIAMTAVSALAERGEQLQQQLQNESLTQSGLERYLNVNQENFGIVLSNLRNANQLITSFKQIVVGEFSAAITEFEISGFLRDLQYVMTPKLKRSRHQVEFVEGQEVLMITQAGALSQVLINLINNALTHAFADGVKGRVTVSYRAMEPVKLVGDADGSAKPVEIVCFTVADNGRGIAAEYQAKIFDKYFTTRMGEGGSGLGLYIVKNLVTRQLDGTIECDSEPGRGTSFKVCIARELPDKPA